MDGFDTACAYKHKCYRGVGLKNDGTLSQPRSASRYMAPTRQATELMMVEAYYMLYGYVTVYLVVVKPQL